MFFRIYDLPINDVLKSHFHLTDRISKSLSEQDMRSQSSRSTIYGPAVDIVEYEDRYEIVGEMPGIEKENLKLTFHKEILKVSASYSSKEVPKCSKVIQKERMTDGTLNRTFRFSGGISGEQITAELTDGVLRITLPKVKKEQPTVISVK